MKRQNSLPPPWFTWSHLSFRFLDVLAARKDPAGLTGEVLIDGAPQPPNFKCLSGYVVQVGETVDDCLVDDLKIKAVRIFDEDFLSPG